MNTQQQLGVMQACLAAQGAVVCALLKTHPAPAQLRASLKAECEETILITEREGTAPEYLDLIRGMVQQYLAQIPET